MNSVFIPALLLHFTSGFCSFLSIAVVFLGSSKLEGEPGFSAPSESSVSDDTASFHTGLEQREFREGGWVSTAHFQRWGEEGEAGLLQQSVQVMMPKMSLDLPCQCSWWCSSNHQRLTVNKCGSVASLSLQTEWSSFRFSVSCGPPSCSV